MITFRYCIKEEKETMHEINNFQEDGICLSCNAKWELFLEEVAKSEAVDNAVERACHPEEVGEEK